MTGHTKEDILATLRRVNGERAEAWLMGQKSDPLFWAVELGGEVGEILNVVKKLVREELGWLGSRATTQDLADEIADGIICLDSLARHYGIDLASAVAAKFNATSDKNGFPHKIALATIPDPEAYMEAARGMREALEAMLTAFEEEGQGDYENAACANAHIAKAAFDAAQGEQ